MKKDPVEEGCQKNWFVSLNAGLNKILWMSENREWGMSKKSGWRFHDPCHIIELSGRLSSF